MPVVPRFSPASSLSKARPCAAYFDWAASAPLSLEASEAMQAVMPHLVGNPSSVHSAGRGVRMLLEAAREAVAGALGASSREIVFTSGGTEADNLALMGAARAAAREGRGRHVVVSAIEHAAVLQAAEALEREGFEVTRVRPDVWGVVAAEACAGVMRPDTALVALMAVNNEVGTLQPVRALASEAHGIGALVFCDAVQALGQVPVDVRAWGVDLLAISSHKVGGPAGAGALYCRAGTEIAPLFHGGWQEEQRRPGTEGVLAAVGMAAAVGAATIDLDARVAACEAVMDRVVAGASRIDGCRLVGSGVPRASHVATFLFEGVEAETLLFALDLAGVAASSGAACRSGSVDPSHVLLAMGLSPDAARSALRLSWGPATRESEIDRLLEALPEAVALNRRARRPGRGTMEAS